jgi:hypothetical protein
MIPIRSRVPPKPKKESDNCEIEIKKTAQGKKIRFKGKCSKEQIKMLSQDELGED